MGKIKRILLFFAGFLVVLVLTACFFIGPYALYHHGSIDDMASYERRVASWKEHEVEFKRDGETLKGWFVEKNDPRLVIFYGGNGAWGAGYMKTVQERIPCSFLTIDYRGYARSTGTPSEDRLVGDAVSILDQVVRETGRSYADVVLVGESLGSGVATQVAAQRPVGGLILFVPFDSVAAVANGLVPPLPLSWVLPDSFRSDRYAPLVKAPVTIFASTLDQVVPVDHARRLCKVFQASRADAAETVHYKEYPEGDHHNLKSQPGFWDEFMKALPKR